MLDPRALALIAITDSVRDGCDGLVARALAAERGGATMIQLRLKETDARTLVEVARALVGALHVPVIVNDRADVAIAAGAAGVHVGTEDLLPAAVRRFAPPDFLIGASVGNDAEVPGAQGADYVGIGPVYPTDSKADAGSAIGVEEFRRLAALCGVPAVAIGGITAATAAECRQAGAAGVAVIRAVLGAPNPEMAARSIRRALDA